MDMLSPIGTIDARPLLGAWALYVEDRIFALMANGRAYFRTGDATLSRYLDCGSRPFVHERTNGRRSVLPYHEVPDHVLADQDLACAWAYDAAAAAG